MYKGKDFIMIITDAPIKAELSGIVNSKSVHVHINGENVNYYEGTDEWLDISPRLNPRVQSSASTTKEVET